MDLVTRMVLDNQNHLTGRWRRERPAIRISQNNREGTGDVKFEVADWGVAKNLVQEGNHGWKEEVQGGIMDEDLEDIYISISSEVISI